MKKKVLILPIVFCSIFNLQCMVYADKYMDTPIYGLDGTLIEGSEEDIIDLEKDNNTSKTDEILRENIKNSKTIYLDYEPINIKDTEKISNLVNDKNIKATYYKDMGLTVALSGKITGNLNFNSLPTNKYFNPETFIKSAVSKSKDELTYNVISIYDSYFNLYKSLIQGDIKDAQENLNNYISVTNNLNKTSISAPVDREFLKVVSPKNNITVYEEGIILKIISNIINTSQEYNLPPITLDTVSSKSKTDLTSINNKAKELFNITIPATENNLTNINKVNMQYAFDLYELYQKEKNISILNDLNKVLRFTVIINNYYK